MSKENIEKEDNTYSGEGMLYGVAAGTIIGAIITMFGVRIDIWTHFMRGCIIDYVH